jgi:hypothetical protein
MSISLCTVAKILKKEWCSDAVFSARICSEFHVTYLPMNWFLHRRSYGRLNIVHRDFFFFMYNTKRSEEVNLPSYNLKQEVLIRINRMLYFDIVWTA